MKVVALGELMLRLSPPDKNRFSQTNTLDMHFGGSEANTAVALSQLGINSAFITRLPDNDISKIAVNGLKAFGVDTSDIVYGGERMGIYYCESGAGIRGGKVIYDRKHSSISEAEISDFDFEKIFENADIFHFTGITTAISDKACAVIESAVKFAGSKGIKISCDLNYRSALWSREKANKVMTKLMTNVDYLIANEGSAFDVFGIKEENDEALAKKLADKFNLSVVALTKRQSISADCNILSGMILKDGETAFSDEITVDIVDRVGGGDCFTAGVIEGILTNRSIKETVDTANALNAFKHTIPGDMIIFSKDEIELISAGNTAGMIKR